MFRTMVFSAFGAALAVCVAVSGLQFLTTEPLILHAEEFELAAGESHSVGPAAETEAPVPADEAWGPAEGIERAVYTVLANLVIGFAVALLLLGAMALKGDRIGARRGLLWGIGGFAAVSLLPAVGLPPELPGTPAADIVERQLWWIIVALTSAVAIALLVFAGDWRLKVLGVFLLVAPHVVGAPQPPSHEVAYPGGLAGQFVVASLAVSALLWSLAGLAAGWLHARLSGG